MNLSAPRANARTRDGGTFAETAAQAKPGRRSGAARPARRACVAGDLFLLDLE
jgi:hypothetical protein